LVPEIAATCAAFCGQSGTALGSYIMSRLP
jgi:hypothetical protein